MAALLAQIPVRPYGVLGQQLTLRKKFIDVAPFPGTISGCVFVDPAGLHHIQPPGGPANAHGAAGAIYKAIGIQKEAAFPPDVIEHVKAAGDAKYHLYTKGAMDVHVIHTVGPDLRKDFDPVGAPGVPFTREQALEALASSYKNILKEFVASGQTSLRLLPVSGGIFAGSFMPEVPVLSYEALQLGLSQLTPTEQESLKAQSSVEMCIFMEKEIQGFADAGFTLPTADASEFVRGVPTRPYGILGQQLTMERKFVDVAPFPSSIPGCVFVDPAGLHHIQPPGGPANVHGAAGAIYKAIGIDHNKSFPLDVIEGVKATGHAKYHAYTNQQGQVHVIHTVGPDFRKDFDPEAAPGVPYTRKQAVEVLATSYKNTLQEFVVSGQPSLRLLPVSGGIHAGGFASEIPALTWDALELGFGQLGIGEQLAVQARQVELCVFAEMELPLFHAAGFKPDATSSSTSVYAHYAEHAGVATGTVIVAMQEALKSVMAQSTETAKEAQEEASAGEDRAAPPPPPSPPHPPSSSEGAATEADSWTYVAPISAAMSRLHVRRVVESKARGSISSSMGMFGIESTYAKGPSVAKADEEEAHGADDGSDDGDFFAAPISKSMAMFGIK